jgi:hypothetical protein
MRHLVASKMGVWGLQRGLEAHGKIINFPMWARDTDRASMPRGPQGQKRPADAVGCAITVAKIATGEMEDQVRKPTGKVRSGRAGAKARAAKLPKDKRTEIARMAALARWHNE